MEGAVIGVHAALEAAQLGTGVRPGFADELFVVAVGIGREFRHDDFQLGAAEAAAEELAADEAVHEKALVGSARLMVVVVLGPEGFQFGGIFPREEFGVGDNAGFQGIR